MLTPRKTSIPLSNYIPHIVFILSLMVFSIGCGKEKAEECEEKKYYQDNDQDGLGNPAISLLACDIPNGYVSNDLDPDDNQVPLEEQRINYNLNSTNLSETYPLKIFIPDVYDSNKNLPVIYLLDGNTYFEDAIKYTKEINFNSIIVGVGGHLANEENNLRRRDFLPGFSFNGAEGGHLKFYKFLTEEVVPYIDANYENDHNTRTLIGHHAAGLFANFTVLNQIPENAYFYGIISINAEIYIPKNITDQVNDINFSIETKDIKMHLSQVSSTTKAKYLYDLLVEKSASWMGIDLFTFVDENTDSFNPSIVEPAIKDGLNFIYNL